MIFLYIHIFEQPGLDFIIVKSGLNFIQNIFNIFQTKLFKDVKCRS